VTAKPEKTSKSWIQSCDISSTLTANCLACVLLRQLGASRTTLAHIVRDFAAAQIELPRQTSI